MEINMAFNEDQKATIREIAWEVGEALSARINENIETALKLHTAECKTAQKVALHEARAKGFITAITIVASTLGAALALIGKHIWSMIAEHKP